jgi:hypothetical protein
MTTQNEDRFDYLGLLQAAENHVIFCEPQFARLDNLALRDRALGYGYTAIDLDLSALSSDEAVASHLLAHHIFDPPSWLTERERRATLDLEDFHDDLFLQHNTDRVLILVDQQGAPDWPDAHLLIPGLANWQYFVNRGYGHSRAGVGTDVRRLAIIWLTSPDSPVVHPATMHHWRGCFAVRTHGLFRPDSSFSKDREQAQKIWPP